MCRLGRNRLVAPVGRGRSRGGPRCRFVTGWLRGTIRKRWTYSISDLVSIINQINECILYHLCRLEFLKVISYSVQLCTGAVCGIKQLCRPAPIKMRSVDARPLSRIATVPCAVSKAPRIVRSTLPQSKIETCSPLYWALGDENTHFSWRTAITVLRDSRPLRLASVVGICFFANFCHN